MTGLYRAMARAGRANVTVIVTELVDLAGDVDPVTRTVRVAAGMTEAETMCTLMFELVMLERGCPVDPVEVAAVEVEAARRLVPLDSLMDALLAGRDEREVAERLGVDEGTLRARRRGLSRGERAELGRRLPARVATGLVLVTG